MGSVCMRCQTVVIYLSLACIMCEHGPFWARCQADTATYACHVISRTAIYRHPCRSVSAAFWVAVLVTFFSSLGQRRHYGAEAVQIWRHSVRTARCQFGWQKQGCS